VKHVVFVSSTDRDAPQSEKLARGARTFSDGRELAYAALIGLCSAATTCASSATSAAPSTRVSELPVVSLPGYSRPLIRIADYLAFLEQHTCDGRTRVR
jgi:hypothetical protein